MPTFKESTLETLHAAAFEISRLEALCTYMPEGAFVPELLDSISRINAMTATVAAMSTKLTPIIAAWLAAQGEGAGDFPASPES